MYECEQKENAEYLRQQIEMRSGGPNTVVAEKQAAADKLRADQDAYAAEARAKAEAKYKQRANMRVQYEKEIEETRRTRRLEKLRDTHGALRVTCLHTPPHDLTA